MASHQNSPKVNINHTAANVRAGQRQAIAQDMRSRGLNPVTVSDVAQRHSTGQGGTGRAILSALLGR